MLQVPITAGWAGGAGGDLNLQPRIKYEEVCVCVCVCMPVCVCVHACVCVCVCVGAIL